MSVSVLGLTMQGAGLTLVPIETTAGRIGQMVEQAHKGQIGAIVKKHAIGYEVIFDDGSSSNGQQFDALSPYTRITPTNLPDINAQAVADLIAKKIEHDAQSNAEFKKMRELKDQKFAYYHKIFEEQYKGFDKSEKMRVRAAKNIKRELSEAFPHVKFSVKSDVNSVRIEWTDGVSAEDVRKISGKYEQCGVDGNQDLKTYDRDSERTALRSVIGYADYIFETRRISDTFREKVHRAIYQRFQEPYPEGVELWEQKIDGDYVSHQFSNDICGRTSFYQGEEFSHLEIVNGRYEVEKTKSADYLNDALKDFTEAANAQDGTPGEAAGKRFWKNPALGGIEIKFDKFFGDDIRAALWKAGFRWHKGKKLYYAKDTPERWQMVENL